MAPRDSIGIPKRVLCRNGLSMLAMCCVSTSLSENVATYFVTGLLLITPALGTVVDGPLLLWACASKTKGSPVASLSGDAAVWRLFDDVVVHLYGDLHWNGAPLIR